MLPSAGPYLLVWIAGAGISLVGAFINAELAAMFPRAGGNRLSPRSVSTLAGFSPVGSTSSRSTQGRSRRWRWSSPWAVPALGLGRAGVLAGASGLVVSVSVVNLVSTRLGARFNNLTSLLKVAAISTFVVLGPLLSEGSFAPWLAEAGMDRGARSRTQGRSRRAFTKSAGRWLRFGQALSPVNEAIDRRAS